MRTIFKSEDRIVWSILAIVLILIGLMRYRLMDVPLERDEGEYAYTGQLILRGLSPWEGAYTMKMPGVGVVYALIITLFGHTHLAVHAGLLIVNEITIVLIFLLARYFVRSLAAVAAAAVFAIYSISWSVQGAFANAEHFVILFASAGLLLVFNAIAAKNNIRLFMAGLLLGLGFIMKQHGLAFCILAVLYVVLDYLLQKPVQWHLLFFKLLALAAGQTAIVVFTLLVVAAVGSLEKFWFWTVAYAGTYLSGNPFAVARVEFTETASNIIFSAPLLWGISGLGLLIMAAGKYRLPLKVFLFLYAVFSFLSICPGFYFREHYFILLLPCAGLLCAISADILYDWFLRLLPASVSCGILILLIAAGLGQTIHRQQNYLFRLTPFQNSRLLYDINPFPESLPVAEYIRENSSPDDTIAVLGSEPQILFYSQRRSASGYIYMYPLMERHEFAQQMQKEFIRDVETEKPKFCVYVDNPLSWDQTEGSHQLIFEWIVPYLQSHYKLVGTVRISDEDAEYQWGPQEWPALTLLSILVLERNDS